MLNFLCSYVFMCPLCQDNSDAAAVITTLVNSLASQDVNYGMLYVLFCFQILIMFALLLLLLFFLQTSHEQ